MKKHRINHFPTQNIHILFLFSLFVLFSCSPKKDASYTIVQGNVIKIAEENYIYFNGERENLKIEKNGSFKDTLPITEPQYVTLSFGNLSTRIYISPGEKTTISVDSTLSFDGDNKEINDYLYWSHQDDSKRQEFEFNFHKEVFSKNETDYIAYRDTIRKEKLFRLQQLPPHTEVFQNFHQKDIEYQYRYDVARYPNYHSFYFNDYQPTSVITSFYDYKSIDNDTHARHYQGYRSLVDLILDRSIENLQDSTLSPLELNLAVISDIQSPTILHDRLNKALFYFTVNEQNMEEMLNCMLHLAKLDKTKKIIREHYEVISELKSGTTAPEFDLENYTGGRTKLSDFRGKYVYIDVWATWCSPCIKEIPYLKKVEHEFANANIEFVSISVDQERFRTTWRNMIQNKKLGGTQLITDNGWNSSFVQNYGLQGLPHFILIDDKGKIVSAKVENPSNPKLKERLYALGL